MTEREGGPRLIEEVLERRTQIAEQKKYAEKAKRQTQGLKDRLVNLLDSHFEQSEIAFHSRREIQELMCVVPSNEGSVEVTIKRAHEGLYGNREEITIDVLELDQLLILRNGGAILESKERSHEELNMHTPIGVILDSWASWSRNAGIEDIQKYQELLDHMSASETVYTPRTIDRS